MQRSLSVIAEFLVWVLLSPYSQDPPTIFTISMSNNIVLLKVPKNGNVEQIFDHSKRLNSLPDQHRHYWCRPHNELHFVPLHFKVASGATVSMSDAQLKG